MRDTRLYHALGDLHLVTDCGLDSLKQDLEELQHRSVDEQWVFLSRLRKLIESELPVPLRIAGLRSFQSAQGWKAWQVVVTQLQSNDSTLQSAALSVLADNASDAPWLWIFGLFHSEPTIRREALAQYLDRTQGILNSWPFHLRFDHACADIVRSSLKERVFKIGLETIAELRMDGTIDSNEAIRLLAQIDSAALRSLLLNGPKIDTSIVEQILDEEVAIQPEVLGAILSDTFAVLLDMIWIESESTTQDIAKVFDTLRDILASSRKSGLAERAFVAGLVISQRHGHWNKRLLALTLPYLPRQLRMEQIPIELRKESVQVLYSMRKSVPHYGVSEFHAILETSVVRMPDGLLDLFVLGGILYWMKKTPYGFYAKFLTVELIAKSFLAHQRTSLPFFTHSGNSSSRTEILNEIQRQKGPDEVQIDAMLCLVLATNLLQFIEAKPRRIRFRIAQQLWCLSNQPEWKLNQRKANRIACILTQGWKRPRFEAFFRFLAQESIDRTTAVDLTLAGIAELSQRIWTNYFAIEMLEQTAIQLKADAFAELALSIPDSFLKVLLNGIDCCSGFPWPCERYLAALLEDHSDADVQHWAASRKIEIAIEEPPQVPPPPPPALTATKLSDEIASEIRLVPDHLLASKVKPCLDQPTIGLCESLQDRLPYVSPIVCAAILGCEDELRLADEQFAKFCESSDRFVSELDTIVVEHWIRHPRPSLFLDAWLFRWERNAFHFADQWMNDPFQVLQTLDLVDGLKSEVLRNHVWQLVRRVYSLLRFRNRSRCIELFQASVVSKLIRNLCTHQGYIAGQILLEMYESQLHADILNQCRDEGLEVLLDASQDIKSLLQPWIDTRGILASSLSNSFSSTESRAISDIQNLHDLHALAQYCLHRDRRTVTAAVQRLLELSDDGARALAQLFANGSVPLHADVIARTISVWSEELRSIAIPWCSDRRFPAPVRFLIAMELHDAGVAEMHGPILAAANEPSNESWLNREDVVRIMNLPLTLFEIACDLIQSPHVHAYRWAIEELKRADCRNDEARNRLVQAYRSFLDLGTERMRESRLEVARRLSELDDDFGNFLLLQEQPKAESFVKMNGTHDFFLGAIESTLLAGDSVVNETLLPNLLVSLREKGEWEESGKAILEACTNASVRQATSEFFNDTQSQAKCTKAVADAFAWGIPVARKLTGKLFRIRMISGEDLGYTRLTENQIYINPLPILNASKNGREVVEGLILHELGHHMYHAGPENEKIWKQAQKEGLQSLLNLVSDEHLERRLRVVDGEYGDKLKRLGSYAFQHSHKEIDVDYLLATLGGKSLEVLSRHRIKVARNRNQVAIGAGDVLLKSEQAGLSFSRFFRALRMGLGNRFNDPKIAEALRLFQGNFRAKSMAELLEITRELKRIFGAETCLLDRFDFDHILGDCEGRVLIDGCGISDQIVQEEIKRIHGRPEPNKGGGGVRVINIAENIEFDKIEHIERIFGDRGSYRKIASEVQREARSFRRFLQELGLVSVMHTRRTRGNRLDRSMLKKLVLQGDPRVLKIREPQLETDLFIGILIDCSGSMAYQEHIEKAKVFAALMAEAARGMASVEVKVLGFTDSTIYDCGNANQPGISGLAAGGGNNDAAALWHAAQLAIQSKRKAKLLVMISDGLPTECSTEALKQLVDKLTLRWGICCAQVAVQPLEVVCFPNYVVLDASNTAKATREFGRVIARLIRKAI